MRFDKDYNKSIFFGFLSGALIGGIAGLLISPIWILFFIIMGILVGFGFAEQHDINDTLSQQKVGVKK